MLNRIAPVSILKSEMNIRFPFYLALVLSNRIARVSTYLSTTHSANLPFTLASNFRHCIKDRCICASMEWYKQLLLCDAYAHADRNPISINLHLTPCIPTSVCDSSLLLYPQDFRQSAGGFSKIGVRVV